VELTRACDPHPLKDLPQGAGEMFDVVDENDTVTGQATRGDVHARGLLHRAVHVFVFNKRGDLLMQQRSMHKDVHPGVWGSSVSGHLDAGEDYAAAALRELDEEMGIRLDEPPEEIARIAPCGATGWEHVRLYRTEHHGAVRFPAAEVSAALWFPVSGISEWIAARPEDFSAGFLACWNVARTSCPEL
jgi:16S rRNA (adenine1518-N6/adenine1519-N6)-dimethyltransferase